MKKSKKYEDALNKKVVITASKDIFKIIVWFNLSIVLMLLGFGIAAEIILYFASFHNIVMSALGFFILVNYFILIIVLSCFYKVVGDWFLGVSQGSW